LHGRITGICNCTITWRGDIRELSLNNQSVRYLWFWQDINEAAGQI